MKEYPANKARSEGKHAGGALCIFKRSLKTTAKYQQNKNFVEFGRDELHGFISLSLNALGDRKNNFA